MTRFLTKLGTLASMILALVLHQRADAQAWTPVPAASFSSLSLAQFADHELEVPYHLFHFAQVANAVVETGTDRGFLNIRVNREPVDNQLHNARIMENQLSLAYFYTADRPWNPYRGHAAVRVRLEAMLDRWARIQNQPGSADGDFDGLFAEYSATNWSQAPTSFGAMHAAEALDLIVDSGLPFDAVVLDNARIALRRALIALFTREDMRRHARQWSNQFNGSYHAALIYLENWPDPTLDAAFAKAVADSAAQDQSPAGFYYEQEGPDFGYSSVHENNLRVALPRLRDRADLLPVVVAEDTHWNDWLAANYVLQPGLSPRTFLTNAGLNTRTSHAFQNPRSRPLAEWAAPSRLFALTDTEFTSAVAARRAQVQTQFGAWGALSVPSAYSYIPAFVFDAVRPLNVWHPTAAQRAAADTAWPSLAVGSANRQFHDPRPVTLTTSKRPAYYAAVTTGNIRITRQNYGLGLLWGPKFGVALQSVANTPSSNTWAYGTRRSGVSGGATYETANLPATVSVAGSGVSPVSGVRDLATGDVTIAYPLAAAGITYGQKTLTLGAARIDVSLTHSGAFAELLPLAHASDAVLTTSATRVVLQRPDGSSFLLQLESPGATLSVGGTSALTTGIARRAVTINASGSLAYSLTVSDTAPPPEVMIPAISVADASLDQPADAPGSLVFSVSLSAPATETVAVNYATSDDTAFAGLHYTGASGTLTFSPGQTSRTIAVPVAQGSLPQGQTLRFNLSLSAPSGAGATLSDAAAVGTIRGVTPPPAGSVFVEYIPGNDWGSGYQGTFKITNTSAATLTDYRLLFEFTGSTITFFNGSVSRSGDLCTFTPQSWQAAIGPVSTFDNLGFQASPGGVSALPQRPRLRILSATGVSALQITTPANLPAVAPGEPYAHTLVAGGGIGPFAWSLAAGASAPPGMILGPDGSLGGTPTTPGAYTFSAQVTDLREVTATRTFTLVVTAPASLYETWRAAHSWPAENTSADTADPDGDGLPNLIEYALGLDPVAGNGSPAARLVVDDPPQLTLTFSRIADPALTYVVEATSDFVSWTPLWTSSGAQNTAGPVTVPDTTSLAAQAHRFLRLRVSR
ncbi:MAG: cellulose binding domain-containing protein [Opitutaceae bacterium]|nr:cellulose binding domain-containing protein [Opitutaceae bacterium]